MQTKPQIMPAASSTITATVQLSAEAAGEYLDVPTRLALISSSSFVDRDLEWRRAYASDDQLGENFENWKGRRPAEGDEDAFQNMLVVDDQIGPAMAREVDAQFAKDPEWDAVRGKTKLADGDEVISVMTEWHADAQLTAILKDAARLRFWAGRTVGRVYIPEEYRDQLTKSPPKTLQEALELVHAQVVDPGEGGPITDAHKRVLGYWYRYSRQPENGERERVLEVHTPKHVLRFVERDGQLKPDWDNVPADNPFYDNQNPASLRRAEYLMWHVDRDGGSAISQSVRDAQDRLNVVATYQGRNDDQTGYRQLIVTNAEQPTDSKGRPVAFPMGPGVALNVRGLMKPGSASKLGTSEEDRHTPAIHVVEPLNPDTFHIPSKREWKRSLLEKLDQLWTLTPETAVSGESKRQSRKPFDNRIGFASQDAGGFMAWALRAALMLAAQILNKTAEYGDVTFQPKLFLDVDAANLEELRVKLNMWQQGALTLTTLLEATPGVSDAVKEAQAVEKGEGTSDQSDAKKAALERLAGGGNGGANA